MSYSAIRCIVDIYVKPESVDRIRAVLLRIVEDSRTEDGCLEYNLFENVNEKSQFTFIEVWENEEAFEDHLQSDHIRKVSGDINDNLIKMPDIKRYKYIQITSKKSNTRKFSRFCVLI